MFDMIIITQRACLQSGSNNINLNIREQLRHCLAAIECVNFW